MMLFELLHNIVIYLKELMHWLRKAVSKILVSASNVVWIHKRANSTSQRQRSLGEWPSTSDGQTLWLLWQLKGQNLENLLSTFCPDSHPGWLTFPHSCPQSWLTTMYQWSSLFQFSTTVLLPSTHFCASVFFPHYSYWLKSFSWVAPPYCSNLHPYFPRSQC